MDLRPAFENRSKVEQFQQKHRVSLLTLLFTDLVGSTKLKQELGDSQALPLLQRHHQLIRDLLSRFPEGEEISTAGDSFFIVFAKPSDAVHFSLRVQAGVRRLSQMAPRPLLDRIGIHIGEVTIEQDSTLPKIKDLYGLQVDICARVMSLAGGDQILLTRSAFDNARQVLKGQDIEDIGALDWLNHGPYLLKGIDDPMEICEAGERNHAVLKAPPDSEKVHRFSPPASEPVLGWRPAVPQPVPGTSWILERKLGEGGFGEVWLAAHKNLRERRVFKFCFRADRVRSLKRELALLRILKERFGEHEHIVKLHDVFLDQPPFYLAMEFVEGGDLPSWTAAQGGFQNVPIAMRLEIVAQVADAIQAAHEAGVIHRDIKPSNILVANSAPVIKLSDFGIGQVVFEELRAGMTLAGFTKTAFDPEAKTAAGTHHYMAPELFAGGSASVASDIYSLGVLLFQMLTGDLSRPITTDWTREIPEPLLRDDLAQCTAHNPKDRFATAGEVAKNLRSFTQRQIANQIEQAHALFEADDAAGALKRLAQVLRQDPSNRFAAERTVFALSQRNFILPGSDPFPHDAEVRQALFSPDGKGILTVTERNVFIWDLHTRERKHQFSFEKPISFAQFSPDGSKLIVVFSENTAQIWNTADELLVASIQPNKEVFSTEFSPDGKKVITTHHGDTAQIWDAITGKPLTELLKHRASVQVRGGMVHTAEFRCDGKQVITQYTGTYPHLWDVETGQRLRLNLKSPQNVPLLPEFARFNPDGQRLLTVASDEIQVWDMQSGEPKAVSLKPKGAIRIPLERECNGFLPQFSPDGNRILAVSTDYAAPLSALQIWDAWTGELLVEKIQRAPNAFGFAKFSADGERILTQPCRVWNSHDGTPLTEPLNLFCAAISPLGERALTVRGKSVQVWEFHSCAPMACPLQSWDQVRNLELSADGQILLSAHADCARLWDLASGEPLTPKLQHSGLVTSARFSSDSRRIVTSSRDKTARIWDARTGQPLSEPLRHAAEVLSAQFSPDNNFIVTTAGDQTVQIWNARTATPVGTPFKHGNSLTSVHVSPDSRSVLTTSLHGRPFVRMGPNGELPPDPEDRLIRIWDIKTGAECAKPLEHDEPIAPFGFSHGTTSCVQFNSDGSKLLSSSFGDLRVWDFADGMATGQIRSATLGTGGWRFARFSSDGKKILDADRNSVRIWDAETRNLTQSLRHLQPPIQTARFSPDGTRVIIACELGLWDGYVRVWDVLTGLPLTECFSESRHQPYDAFFSPDGTRIISALAGARVWEFPVLPLPVPAWFPELAEAVAGLGLENDSADTRDSTFLKLKRQINESVGDDFYTKWARWILNDSQSRPGSLLVSRTVGQHARRENPLHSVARARTEVIRAPQSGLAVARLAASILRGYPPPGQRQLGEADWHSHRALQLAPDLPETWTTRADVLERINRLPEALEAIDHAIQITPDQAELWSRKGSILQKGGHLDKAYDAFTKAIGLLPPASEDYSSVYRRQEYFMQRSLLLTSLGRQSEALADKFSAYNIPARDASAPATLIDLDPYYNSGFEHLYVVSQGGVRTKMKHGLHTFATVEFDLRGMVKFWSDEETGTEERCVSIQAACKCRNLHFLHGALNLHMAEGESEIGRFVIHFENGHKELVPLFFGRDIGDREKYPHLESRILILPLPASGDDGLPTEFDNPVFLKSWKNPFPDLALRQIDFVATLDEGSPPQLFLVAITAV